jgi:DNA invertase Pin-like site-specific DNA recombinase
MVPRKHHKNDTNRTGGTTDPHRVIGYIRVSTEDQALGPVAQRHALERWCAANGAELVTVFEDRVCGGVALDKRPGLLAALDALPVHRAGVLLVAKRDRLARDVMNTAMIERLAERVGARVRSAAGEGTEGDVLDDPSAMLMRGIVDVFAQYERAVIRARTRAALGVKKARGERVGSVPYGFRLGGDGVRLEADVDEQRTGDLVHELRAKGLSLRAIGARLTAAGCRPRSGGPWHPDTVARIAAARGRV